MGDGRVIEELRVFPLPGAFLLPGTVLPLHIFEARYRAMLRDALEDDGMIAIAIPDPKRPANFRGESGIGSVVCVGEVARHEQLPDGRSNIWLRGVGRAYVTYEMSTDHPYRIVVAQRMSPVIEFERAAEQAEAIRGLLRSLVSVGDERAALFARLSDESVAPRLLSDVLPAVLLDDPQLLRAAVEESDVNVRLDDVVDLLEDRLLGHAAGTSPS